MNLNELYTQIITENSRSKENRHPVEGATHSLEGVNPSCGDDITLQLRVKDVKIEDAGSVGLFGSPVKIAKEISVRIKRELGITVSIGVSFNKITAKLGSDYKMPDAITVIEPDTYKQIVYTLPVGDLL